MPDAIEFKFEVRDRNDVHTRVSVFAGPFGRTLGCCGQLTMRNEEWESWVAMLRAVEGGAVELPYAEATSASPSWIRAVRPNAPFPPPFTAAKMLMSEGPALGPVVPGRTWDEAMGEFVNVAVDIPLESGSVLRAGTRARVTSRAGDFVGLQWRDGEGTHVGAFPLSKTFVPDE